MPSLPGLSGYRNRLRRITAESNGTLMQVVDDLVAVCRDGATQTFEPEELATRGEAYVEELLRERNSFVLVNQDELLTAAGVAT
jgi:hypothetical protein